MQIRTAIPEDTQKIIELLKQSLGESTVPKSEALWQWKHEANPFGSSYVLLAEENEVIIGVRAFMKWQWKWKGRIYNAVRAVDTATHPNHQGKGIFKKLTLQQVEVCRKDNVDFIFNTPNTQSKPGYLKMGWVEQHKVPLKLRVASVSKKPDNVTVSETFNWSDELTQLLNNHVTNWDQLITNISADYIKWRYINNPLFNYHCITDNENFLLISRIKEQKRFMELRLVDFMLFKEDAKKLNSYIKDKVLEFCKVHSINVISFSGRQFSNFKKHFKWMGFIPVQSAGPVVTLKDLNMENDFQKLLQIKNWGYSLGDLELF